MIQRNSLLDLQNRLQAVSAALLSTPVVRRPARSNHPATQLNQSTAEQAHLHDPSPATVDPLPSVPPTSTCSPNASTPRVLRTPLLPSPHLLPSSSLHSPPRPPPPRPLFLPPATRSLLPPPLHLLPPPLPLPLLPRRAVHHQLPPPRPPRFSPILPPHPTHLHVLPTPPQLPLPLLLPRRRPRRRRKCPGEARGEFGEDEEGRWEVGRVWEGAEGDNLLGCGLGGGRGSGVGRYVLVDQGYVGARMNGVGWVLGAVVRVRCGGTAWWCGCSLFSLLSSLFQRRVSLSLKLMSTATALRFVTTIQKMRSVLLIRSSSLLQVSQSVCLSSTAQTAPHSAPLATALAELRSINLRDLSCSLATKHNRLRRTSPPSNKCNPPPNGSPPRDPASRSSPPVGCNPF